MARENCSKSADRSTRCWSRRSGPQVPMTDGLQATTRPRSRAPMARQKYMRVSSPIQPPARQATHLCRPLLQHRERRMRAAAVHRLCSAISCRGREVNSNTNPRTYFRRKHTRVLKSKLSQSRRVPGGGTSANGPWGWTGSRNEGFAWCSHIGRVQKLIA
jgi:hypothetical protein